MISSTLYSLNWKNSVLIKDNIAEEIQKLKQQPGKNIGVAGGATVAQTLAKLGLIDQYLLIVHPVILGKGKPLLGELGNRQKLTLLGKQTFNSGAVELNYTRIP